MCDHRHGKLVRFRPSEPFDPRLLTGLPEVTTVERQGEHVLVSGSGQLINAVILALAAAGVTALDVELETASLEDAFLELTDRTIDDGGAAPRQAPEARGGDAR